MMPNRQFRKALAAKFQRNLDAEDARGRTLMPNRAAQTDLLINALRWWIDDDARLASFSIIARSHGFKRELDAAIERSRTAIVASKEGPNV